MLRSNFIGSNEKNKKLYVSSAKTVKERIESREYEFVFMNHTILSHTSPFFSLLHFFPAIALFNKQMCLWGTGRRALTKMIYTAKLQNNNVTKVCTITELVKSCFNTLLCI